MPDDLYDRDILTWSEQQAALLRRLAAGERLNDAVDWPNLIEEIEAVGRSERLSCESLLLQALIHLLKLNAWPSSQAQAHWTGEVSGFLDGARRHYTPSMRQGIALADLYASALRKVRLGSKDKTRTAALPDACPFTLDDLVGAVPDIAALISRLAV